MKINITKSGIMRYVKPHLLSLGLLLMGTILSTWISAVYPYIFSKIIDEVFYAKVLDRLWYLLLIYLAIFIFNQLIYFVVNMSWANLMTHFVFDIRRHMFNRVMSLKGKHLSSMNTGDMISRINQDSDQLFRFIYWNIFYTINDVLSLIISIAFISYYSVKLSVATVILVPITVYVARFFAKKVKKKYEKIKEYQGLLTAWLYEVLRGMQEIRLLNAVGNIIIEHSMRTSLVMRMSIEKDKTQVVAERVNAFIKTSGQVLIYGISSWLICKGSMSVGGFVACVTYFALCIKGFEDLNFVYLGIAENSVAINRVSEVLNMETENYNEDVGDITIYSGSIEFKDVCFAYEDSLNLLYHFTLSIRAGEKVAVVGHSGSGKSTMANLLYRLYEVNSGEIRVDGTNIQDFNLYNLREQIGIVHQESIFFEGTIRYNITFTNDMSNDKEIWDVLENVSMADYIRSLPEGLETIVGTGPGIFSGGQKQRLAIARILFKKPKIIVFDEATAFLDSESENAIKETWESLEKEEITMIVIAHRASTIIDFKRIIVIEDGNIIGDGKHNDLMKSCDTYQKLFAVQEG